jgi:hypothetical protein
MSVCLVPEDCLLSRFPSVRPSVRTSQIKNDVLWTSPHWRLWRPSVGNNGMRSYTILDTSEVGEWSSATSLWWHHRLRCRLYLSDNSRMDKLIFLKSVTNIMPFQRIADSLFLSFPLSVMLTWTLELLRQKDNPPRWRHRPWWSPQGWRQHGNKTGAIFPTHASITDCNCCCKSYEIKEGTYVILFFHAFVQCFVWPVERAPVALLCLQIPSLISQSHARLCRCVLSSPLRHTELELISISRPIFHYCRMFSS